MGCLHGPADDLRDLRAVLADPDLSTTERIVMTSLLLHRNGDSGRMDPSVTRVAQQCGLTGRSVIRALARLEERGWLLRDRRPGVRTKYSARIPTGDTESPVTQSHQCHKDTRPVTQSHRTGDTESPERTKNERSNEDFERAMEAYPRRAGGNSKTAAFKAWTARTKAGIEPSALIAGVERYAAYIEATGKAGTEYVKQAATFFGPNEHWAEPWTAPHTNGRTNGPAIERLR